MEWWLRYVVGVATLLVTTSAAAQAPGVTTEIQIERFEPQHSHGVNLMNLARSEVLGHGVFSVGVFLDHSDDPLVLRLLDGGGTGVDRDGDGFERVIRHQQVVDFALGVGLFDVFDVGLVMPIVLSRSGDDLARFDRPGDVAGSFALGDLRVVPKIRLLDAFDNALGLGVALGGTIYVPTGDADNFASYGDFRATPFVALDWWSKRNGVNVALNVGYAFQPRRVLNNLILGDTLQWGLGVDVPTPVSVLRMFGLLHASVEFEEIEDADAVATDVAELSDDLLEWELGFTVRISDFVITMGGGGGFTDAPGSPEFRIIIGGGYVPQEGVVDNDQDGVSNIDDACEGSAEDLDGYFDLDGCPDEDNDGDGVLDVRDGEADESGFGRCRDLSEDVDGFEDDDGCPDLDNDGDGILDVDDECPNDAEDVDGFMDDDGCPDEDDDGDGVPDAHDGPGSDGVGACAKQPETVNGYMDDDGCPDTAPEHARLDAGRVALLTPITFTRGQSRPTAASEPVLDDVAKILHDHPHLGRVTISGHTGARGAAGSNQRISLRRAQAVVEALAERGVASARLEAVGYGEDRPLVPASEPDAEQRNERIEITFALAAPEPAPEDATTPDE